MINKKYWDNFYEKNKVISEETDFARFTLNSIKNIRLEGELLDIACGNGRDSSYFMDNGILTTGIDLSIELEDVNFNFIKGNLFDIDLSTYKILYLRFVVHTLTEIELEKLLNKIELINGVYIFIETRSSKGITNEEKSETHFKSSIGDEHFRMLYSKNYLDNKFSNFEVIQSSEGKYSKFGSDDPYCLRYILRNKTNNII